MKAPRGYTRQALVLRLLKGLYGLKQSAVVQQEVLTNRLRSLSYYPLYADSCVQRNKVGLVVAMYIDDLVLFRLTKEALSLLKQQLIESFEIIDVGKVLLLLGIQLHQSSRAIIIDQAHYIRALLQQYKLQDAKTTTTPTNGYDRIALAQQREPLIVETLYQTLIGALLQVARGTRLDIAFVVVRLETYNIAFIQRYYNIVLYILYYL